MAVNRSDRAMNIVIADVSRGGIVESCHVGAFVVADAEGGIVLSGGDPARPTYPRSSVKAFQALPLLAGGAAERFGLGGEALALACASHVGTPLHTGVAAAMLARAGCDAGCLECGVQWPSSNSASRALTAAGVGPSALHNNCSGKHAGFICTAVAAGHDPIGYVGAEHPVMRRVTEAVGIVTGADMGAAPRGVDGCSIPTFAMPLQAVAAGFARFGAGRHLPAEFAAAAGVLRQAVAANPVMIAGDGCFDTVLTAAFGARLFIKSGAEGVCCGALPELGLGFALKAEDGSLRAAEAASASLLRRLLGPHEVLDALAAPVLTNWNGIAVGAVTGRLG
jgi:L-asparaginase II